ncbi:hypothetical protein SERLA73DRAFT_147942 [Serpula lacrymans var. lacrymans S7.3]|uniref:Uncharacterized protein n=1 Tax=Serpula lacrymans var. lacrymans (strain S7.3) TaxID=936435 RepID=F8QID0_SERL3|nr:hypothetical protein SERLA73DRAFT_147942 [Serpula lacrymans var. lacrymans S7.3]
MSALGTCLHSLASDHSSCHLMLTVHPNVLVLIPTKRGLLCLEIRSSSDAVNFFAPDYNLAESLNVVH